WLAVAAARNAAYDRGWLQAHDAGVPVGSVGNLTAGGTGKTPFVAWLAGELRRAGRTVAIVSRGHGGAPPAPVVVVEHDPARPGHAARVAGDEPAMLAAAGAADLVVVGRDRVAAARLAAARGADVVVLDDGFQHRRLTRRLDIVLVDARDPFGGGRALPAGLLRESPAGLARADLCVLTRAAPELAARDGWIEPDRLPPEFAAQLARLGPAAPPVCAAALRPQALELPDGRCVAPDALAGRPVLLVSGIAGPQGFERTVAALGARIAAHLAWPDHHPFSPADARRIAEALRESGAELVVTTRKDRIRWPQDAPQPAVLDVGIETAAGPRIVARVLDAIGPREPDRR
ncbi:MAG: tetraacyldisaccharide 4'-kinase, partial [Acidobacteria bacterium]